MLAIVIVLRMLREEVSAKSRRCRITSSTVATNELTCPRVYLDMIFLFNPRLIRVLTCSIHGVSKLILREWTCHNSQFPVGTLDVEVTI